MLIKRHIMERQTTRQTHIKTNYCSTCASRVLDFFLLQDLSGLPMSTGFKVDLVC